MTISVPTCPVCGGAIHETGRLLLDLDGGLVVSPNGAKAKLTPSEMTIFAAVWRNRPRVQTAEHLLHLTSKPGREDDREIEIVTVQMSRLRKRLRPLGIHIERLRGEGFRIINSEAA